MKKYSYSKVNLEKEKEKDNTQTYTKKKTTESKRSIIQYNQNKIKEMLTNTKKKVSNQKAPVVDEEVFQHLMNLYIPSYISKKFDCIRKRKLYHKLDNLIKLPFMPNQELVEFLLEVISNSEVNLYNNYSEINKFNYCFIYCGPTLININPGPKSPNLISSNHKGSTRNNKGSKGKESILSNKSTFDILGTSYLNFNDWLSKNVKYSDEGHPSFIKNHIMYTESNPEPPHLYSYIKKVYDIMFSEKKNQAVLINGELGSGKTFSLIHAIEALTYISQISSTEEIAKINDKANKNFSKGDKGIPSYLNYINENDGKNTIVDKLMYSNSAPYAKVIKEKKGKPNSVNKEVVFNDVINYTAINNFDVIHRSFQLIHIISSIFRNENMESTCSGVLLKLGFNPFTGKLSSFDMDATILDITLPFSQNGRTLSILHALVNGANESVKKTINMPESCAHNLNFLKKFNFVFDRETQEKFKLCDYEVYTRFYTLLTQFRFSRTEISDIYKMLSFILQCNDLNVGKREVAYELEFNNVNKEIKQRNSKFVNAMFVKEKTKTQYEYSLLANGTTKLLSACLDMSEIEFIQSFGVYNNIEDIKTSIIALMKFGYQQVFDFILLKVKEFLKIYFYCVNTGLHIEEFYYKSEREKSKNLTELLRGVIQTNGNVMINSRNFNASELNFIMGNRRKESLSTIRESISNNTILSNFNINNIHDASNIINRNLKNLNKKKIEKLEINEYSLLKESVHINQLNYHNSKLYQMYNMANSSGNIREEDNSFSFSPYKKNVKNEEKERNNHNTNSPEELFIYFIDSPGEVKDQTLGGLCSNIFNECVNLLGSNQFHAVVKNLEDDNVNMSQMSRLKCCNIVKASLGSLGILNFLHLPRESQIINMLANSNYINNSSNSNSNSNNNTNLNVNNVIEIVNKEDVINSLNRNPSGLKNNEIINRKFGHQFQTKFNKTIINSAVEDLSIANMQAYINLSANSESFKQVKGNEKNTPTFPFDFFCLNENVINYSNTNFQANFTNSKVLYDFKNLSLETRTIISTANIENIFKLSRNTVCYYLNSHEEIKDLPGIVNSSSKSKSKWYVPNKFNSNSEIEYNNFYYERESVSSLMNFKLKKIFNSLLDIQPFIIYMLHSTSSVQEYFDNSVDQVMNVRVKSKSKLTKQNPKLSASLYPLNNFNIRGSNANPNITGSILNSKANKSNKSLIRSSTSNNNIINKQFVKSNTVLPVSTFHKRVDTNRLTSRSVTKQNESLEASFEESKLNLRVFQKTNVFIHSSLVLPILHWKWLNYPTCLTYKSFVGMFFDEFEAAKNTLFSYSLSYNKSLRDINLPLMNDKEKSEFMLNILLYPGNFKLGANHVWLKSNSLKYIQNSLNSLKQNSERKKTLMAFSKQKSFIDQSSGSAVHLLKSDSIKRLTGSMISRGIESDMNLKKLQRTRTSVNNKSATNLKVISNNHDIYVNSFYYKNSILNNENRLFCPVNSISFTASKVHDYRDIARSSSKIGFSPTANNIINKTFKSSSTIRRSVTQNQLKDFVSLSPNVENSKMVKKVLSVNNFSDENFNKTDELGLKSIFNKVRVNLYSDNSIYSNLESYIKRFEYLKNDVEFIQISESKSSSKAQTTENNDEKNNNKFNLGEETIKEEKEKKLKFNYANKQNNKDCTSYSYQQIVKKKAEFLSKNNNQNIPKSHNPLSKYNILEPTKQNLHIIKSIFDFQKQNKYHIFDYNEYSSSILLLQKNIRGYLMRKKYKSLVYGIYCIILIQKMARGLLKRKKFSKFKIVLRKIRKIQKFYKKRMALKINSIIKIQCLYRSLKAKQLASMKYNKKIMKILVYLEETGQVKDVNDPKFRENFNPKLYSYPADLELDNSDIENEERIIENDLDGLSAQSIIKEATNQRVVSKNSTNPHYELVKRLEGANNEEIVEILMSDMKNLLKEQHTLSSRYKNVDKYLNNKPVYNKIDQETLGLNKYRDKQTKIEDRLIQYGQNLNIKRSQKLHEQTNDMYKKFPYQPNALNKDRIYNPLNLPSNDFLERQEIYKQLQVEKMSRIREKHPNEDLVDATFKPEISIKAKVLKRDIDDLFKWKDTRDNKLTLKKMDKELKQQQLDEKLMIEAEKNSVHNKNRINKSNSTSNFGQNKLTNQIDKQILSKDDMNSYIKPQANFQGYFYKAKPEDNKYVNFAKIYDDALKQKLKNADLVNQDFSNLVRYEEEISEEQSKNEIADSTIRNKNIQESSINNINAEEIGVLDLWN